MCNFWLTKRHTGSYTNHKSIKTKTIMKKQLEKTEERRCANNKNYQIVFKSGAIITIEKACLYIGSTGTSTKKTYTFKRQINGIDINIAPILKVNNIDGIIIL